MDRLTRLNAVAAVVLFAALTVVVSLQVFTRFVLHIPFIWSEEVARFLFFWVVLLGAALSVRSRRHFTIDIGIGRTIATGRRAGFLLDVIPDLCVLGFSVFLLVQGLEYTRSGVLRTATNSGVNMAFVYAAIPVFALLSIVYSASGLLRALSGRGRDAAPARRSQTAE